MCINREVLNRRNCCEREIECNNGCNNGLERIMVRGPRCKPECGNHDGCGCGCGCGCGNNGCGNHHGCGCDCGCGCGNNGCGCGSECIEPRVINEANNRCNCGNNGCCREERRLHHSFNEYIECLLSNIEEPRNTCPR